MRRLAGAAAALGGLIPAAVLAGPAVAASMAGPPPVTVLTRGPDTGTRGHLHLRNRGVVGKQPGA